jgi:hypothetical protein
MIGRKLASDVVYCNLPVEDAALLLLSTVWAHATCALTVAEQARNMSL